MPCTPPPPRRKRYAITAEAPGKSLMRRLLVDSASSGSKKASRGRCVQSAVVLACIEKYTFLVYHTVVVTAPNATAQAGSHSEDYQSREEKEYPYVVALIDPLDFDHDDIAPRAFKTWKEAIAKQVEWNKSYETADSQGKETKER